MRGIGFLGLIFCLASSACAAFERGENPAQASVQMRVELGFNGHYVIEQFTPVRVQLQNKGHESISGVLEISQLWEGAPNEAIKETTSLPVELPRGAKKAVQVSIAIGRYVDRLEVVLRDEKAPKKIYQNQEIKLHEEYMPEPQKLVLALSDAPFPSKLPTGEPVQVIRVEELPAEATAYGGVRRLYLHKIRTEGLLSSQRRALVNWLLGGGELVIFSGDNWYRQRSHFLEELVPMKVADTTEIQLWGNVLTIVIGEPRGMVLLRAPDDSPLLLKRTFGAGTILFSTVNPFAAEIGGFWELLKPPTQEGEEQGAQSPLEFLGRLTLPMPSLLEVSRLVIVFIVGFGFLGLLATRDKKYLWALFAWVVLLSVASAIYMSNPAFAKSLRSLEVSICRSMSEGSRAAASFCQLWYGISSQVSMDLSISAGSATAVQQLLPAKPARYAYERDGLKILMRLEKGGKHHFYLESPKEAAVTFSLEGNGEALIVKVDNRSDHDLLDAILIKEGKVFHLGELKAQAVTERRLAAESFNYFERKREALGGVEDRIKRRLLELAKAQDLRDALLAWSRQEELSTHPREEKIVINLIIVEAVRPPRQ